MFFSPSFMPPILWSPIEPPDFEPTTATCRKALHQCIKQFLYSTETNRSLPHSVDGKWNRLATLNLSPGCTCAIRVFFSSCRLLRRLVCTGGFLGMIDWKNVKQSSRDGYDNFPMDENLQVSSVSKTIKDHRL